MKIALLLVVHEILVVGSHAMEITSPATAQDLAAIIAGENIEIMNATLEYTHAKQAGLFAGGSDSIGLASGAVLSSAWAEDALGPNDNRYDSGSGSLGGPGSASLDQLLSNARATSDACALRINFKCRNETNLLLAEFTYVFGSDNYPSNGNKPNEDLMGAFLDGENWYDNTAVVKLGKTGRKFKTYVSVNTLHKGRNFRDNRDGSYDTEMDGFTAPLKADAFVKHGNHELVLVVADGSRVHPGRRGAWLFLEAQSLRCLSLPPSARKTRIPDAEKCARTICSRNFCHCNSLSKSCCHSATYGACDMPQKSLQNHQPERFMDEVYRYFSYKCRAGSC